jgi:hypothetical protein
MAGSGKKTFTAGDVLTASDVNNYLMDQTVMVFGGTAARSSAIPTPSEGMFAVTTDNDELDYYNGSAWVPALPVGEWQSYTPTLSGGWTNGNGTYVAQYCQIGKTVHLSISFVLGTSTTKGANMIFSLPVEAKRTVPNPFTNVFLVAGGSSNIGITSFESSTAVRIYLFNTSTTYGTFSNITASIPTTWVTGDQIRFALTYEAV